MIFFEKTKGFIISLVAGFTVALILLFFTSKTPFNAICSFFAGPFSSTFYLGSMLNTSSILLFASIGIALSFNAGCFNLGGEGQIYIAGFLTAFLLNEFSFLPPFVALIIVFLIVIFTSILVGLFSGLLKVYKNVNELLTSFLLSNSIIPIINYLVCDPLRDQNGTLLALPFIEKSFRLKKIMPPSTLNISFFIALLLVLVVYFWLFKTKSGYVFRTCGKAKEFAYFCGFSPNKTTILGMSLSSAMHGFSGFFAVCGTYYTCHNEFYLGLGWNALSVALMAKSHPLALIPASLIMSYLLTASDTAIISNNLNNDATNIIQGAILLTISIQFVAKSLNKKKDL